MTRPRRALHVLVVHDAYDDYVTCLVNSLAERAHVTVLHSAALHARMRAVLSPDAATVVYPHHRVRDPRRLRAIPAIDGVAAAVGADVVHVQQSNDPSFNLVQIASRPWTPHVLTVHDVRPHPGDRTHVPGGHLTLRVQRRRFDRFVAHSSPLRDDLSRVWRVPTERIDVIPHGELGTLYRAQAAVGPTGGHGWKTARVLFFGRVWHYKGLDLLIMAMNRLASTRPGLTLTIAGTGEPLDRYLADVQPQLIVEVHDRHIPAHEVAALFDSAAVVCLPYREASQSGVQALACGLGVPVVATAVGGLATATSDGVDGLLVPPDDVPSLTAALAAVIDDPGLRVGLAAGARARSANELNWGVVADRTLETYTRVVAERATR